jgi:hypothetical protein
VPQADDVWAVCGEVLQAALVGLATLPAGAPARNFVGYVTPGADCDCAGGGQVACWPTQIRESATRTAGGTEGGHHVALNNVVIEVAMTLQIIRCIPTISDTGKPPTPAQIDNASHAIHSDAWFLWCWLREEKRAERLLAGLCREIWFDAMTPEPALGGCAGWNVNLRTQIDGYKPVVA